jgi:WD40 repeat protein
LAAAADCKLYILFIFIYHPNRPKKYRSFGCVLYELITLDKLFQGTNVNEIQTKVLKQPISFPTRSLGPKLRYALKKSLEKDAKERATSHELQQELATCQEIDASRLVCSKTLTGQHTGGVMSLAVLDDGLKIASGGADKSIVIWNTYEGTCVRKIRGTHSNPVTCLISLSKSRLLVSAAGESIKIWNYENGKCLNKLTGHEKNVCCLLELDSSSGPGDLVASGSDDETVRIWRVTASKPEQTLHGHTKAVKCLLKHGANLLISGSNDGLIIIWSLDGGQCLHTLHDQNSHQVRCLLVSANRILSGGQDTKIKVWGVQDFKCKNTFKGHAKSMSYLGLLENEKVVSGDTDGTIKTWDRDLTSYKEKRLQTKDSRTGHVDLINCFVLVNESELASASSDGTIKFWTNCPAEINF